MRMIDEDEVGLKERHQMHQKDYIEIRSEASGVRENDSIPTLPLLGLRTRESASVSRLKAPSGEVKIPAKWRLQPSL